MEGTALSVGKSVLSGALGYAKSAFAEEVALQLGIQQDQAFVTDELEMMQSFMMAAHEERDNNKVVKTWVKQVRDTAYDVEESLQDFAIRLDRPSWWNALPTLLERRRVAKQMKKLRAKVEDVSQRNVRYRLIKASGSNATDKQSSIIDAAMFGVDDARRAARHDKKRVDLAQLISKDDEDPKVIAVWGTSGDIGQTSLIRAAYEDPDVQSKFPVRAWVRVMHPFRPKGFVQSLVNQFHSAQGVEGLLETKKTRHQDLAQEFNGYANEKRCLIVLNRLSTIEEWDQIKTCFQTIKKGSRIIVLTSQVEVASLCAGKESQASELKQLSADQTLYAFYDKGSQDGKDLVKPVSVSDVASTSTNDHTLAPNEIIQEQSKDADENKMVEKSLTRIRTSAGTFEESELIGRAKEISHINKLISSKDSQQVQVISLWGMGGLGKTTLVEGVYQSQKLSDKFEKCVFVTIMRPFHPVELLRSLAVRLDEASSKEELIMSHEIGRKALPTMGLEELIAELPRLLKKKSCLIVLDDLLHITEWDPIISRLIPLMEKTSQMIVTTRKQNIAKHCSGKHGKVYHLKVLEDDDALGLFSKKVFGEAKDLVEKNPELVNEAKLILKKCGGLPLAIVTIGGFLANRPKTQAEWRKLSENISAELEMNPELGMLRTVLEKSYDGLPYHLKSCFLYLSIFPEDQIICRRRLVRRWTAEGYSSKTRGKSANEIADTYFTDLQNRSMILPSQQSVYSRKSIDSCKIHDLIREIAISKSVEENLVFRLEEGCWLNTHGTVRHVAISSNWKGDQSEFESTVDLSRIRSLSVFAKWRPFFISNKMRFLRVLDLEGTEDLEERHLENVGELLHLKYLSLRGCWGISPLPDSLGNLRQLQTLDIKKTDIVTLPKTIIRLRKLQYFHAGGYPFRRDTNLMERCRGLFGVGLFRCATCCAPRHMDIDGLNWRDACTFACCVEIPAVMTGYGNDDGARVPIGIGQLKDLHTLRFVNVGMGNAVLQDIKRLTGLRKLGVSCINKKNAQAFCLAISNLSSLESLAVQSFEDPGLCGCLNKISSPPENLQSLKLIGNLETLPEWIKKLQHLVKLTLILTNLRDHDAAMEFLGSLPKMEILVLRRSSFEGEKLHFPCQRTETIAFGSLRVLNLDGIEEFKLVKFEAAMPKLERLHVNWIKYDIGLGGLELHPNIIEVRLTGVDFVVEARDSEAIEEERQEEEEIQEKEARRKRQKEEARRKFKKKVQDRLAGNPNQPILTVENQPILRH